ncbi:hypothetical protein WJX82_000186 [Trebouxia sp. C0006]
MQRATGGSRPNPGLAAKLEQERRLKEGISGHKTGLPKKLLELFSARPPLDTLTSIKHRKPKFAYNGIGQYVHLFPEPTDPEYEPQLDGHVEGERRFRNPELATQAQVNQESKAEKKTRVLEEQKQAAEDAVQKGVEEWNPKDDPHAQGDAFKTLFVSRISFETTEKKLKREFEEYGPIKRLRMVQDATGKPRGYAFIEYEHKNNMKEAYKRADGKKVEGKRVVVDVERGRTVPNWRPRRLGGGKGGEGREPREPKDPNKRMKAGLPPNALPGALGDRAPHVGREADRGADRDAPPPRERREEPPPRPREHERERERPANGHRDSYGQRDATPRDRPHERERERDRDRPSERKRERDTPVQRDDGRSSKRHREDGEREPGSSRRRERDMV